MELQRSLSTRTLHDLQDNEHVLDLTNGNVILDFANSIRKLSPIRRQAIWTQNVHINNIVLSQTKSHKHMDDILLFLIIIYSKEQYPEEEEALISKLKQFVGSQPFTSIKQHLHERYFPLLQDEFISNHNYFASTIEEYANNELITLKRLKRAHTLPHDMHNNNNNNNTRAHHINEHNKDYNEETITLYNKLEDKMMHLFTKKFKQLEYKINNLSNEVKLIKYAMIEDAKDNMTNNSDEIMDEIKLIKREISKLMKIQKNTKHNNNSNKNKSQSMQKSQKVNVQRNDLKMDELKKWIENECELIEYFDLFIQNGIDNLEIIQHITITDLALIGINKLPHRVKIMQSIQKLKYETQLLFQEQQNKTKSI